MPWKEASAVSLRREFVRLAMYDGANMSQLCLRYHISRKTGYKWLARYRAAGAIGLADRSRKPARSPHRTPLEVERAVLELRSRHPVWGGRKLRARLLAQGVHDVPAASTITAILRRHDRLDPQESAKHRAWRRFEAQAPNELWQMDFKGHFALVRSGRCHPLTVLDDHSRFCLGLRACGNERESTVRAELTAIFRRYGLPSALLTDNGMPWATTQAEFRRTKLEAWLIRLGVGVKHTGIAHPQTIGKDERFHRTLKAEVLRQRLLHDLPHAQIHFDRWRHVYNLERPHEALAMGVPVDRFQPSLHSFPETLPPVEYPPGAIVRKVGREGMITYYSRLYHVGKGLVGYPVALQPTDVDGTLAVYFCHQKVAEINLHIEQSEP